MTTWMITALGARNRSTGMCGIPTMSAQTGRLTATVTGTGSARGAGPGWAMSLGVLRLTTTAAGHISEADGVGARDRSLVLRFTDRLLSAGLGGAGAVAGGRSLVPGFPARFLSAGLGGAGALASPWA